MKRLTTVVVLVTALATAALAAAAGVARADPTMTLLVNGRSSPATVAQGTALTFTGAAPSTWVKVWQFPDAACTIGGGVQVGSQTAVIGGLYTVSGPTLTVGTYYFQGWTTDNSGVHSPCVTVHVVVPSAAVAPPPDGVFLCYSAFQDNPGVWPKDVAATLLAGGGYWSPYAVKGTIAGGTNIGGYHLACNLASGQSAGDSFVGGAGEVYGPTLHGALTGTPGVYPTVGP